MAKKIIWMVLFVSIFICPNVSTLEAEESIDVSKNESSLKEIGPNKVSEYFPVDEGNKWTYKTSISYGKEPLEGDTTIIVNNKELLEGSEVYPLELNRLNEKTIAYYSFDDEAIYIHKVFDGNMYTLFSPAIKIKLILPDQENTEKQQVILSKIKIFEANGGLKGEGVCKIEVQFEGFENIVVPAGSFENCLKVSFSIITQTNASASVKQTMWLAKGIGEVKEEKHQTINMLTADFQNKTIESDVKMELKSAEIKGQVIVNQ